MWRRIFRERREWWFRAEVIINQYDIANSYISQVNSMDVYIKYQSISTCDALQGFWLISAKI